jgi:spermidine synthase
VLFASTAGSLAGVFGTSHVLLPEFGIRRTFWLAAGLLLVAAIATHVLVRAGARRWSSVLVWIGLAGISVAVRPEHPPLRSSRVELAQRESSYQALRVVEERGPDGVLRFLQVNEGFDSFQSVWRPERGLLPVGFYYNDFLLPASWSADRDPWRVLVLGLGAGSVTRVFAREEWPRARFVGVELDPVVVALGREFFDLDEEGERLEVWAGMDARLALRIGDEPFEQIVLDCYANQVEIPAHLCTVEFFREARDRLVPGGWLTANLGGFGFDDPVVIAVASTCARAFDASVLLVRVPESRNFVLLARQLAPLPWNEEGLVEPTASSALVLGPRLLPGSAREVRPDPAIEILTDDRCPIEELQLRSIREAQRHRRPEET